MERDVVLSVIVTVAAEPEPLDELLHEFGKPLSELGLSFETLIVVARGRLAAAPLRARIASTPGAVRVIEAPPRAGESELLALGADAARGRILLTLPSRRQVEAAVLPTLVRRVEDGADLAVAWRFPRVDAPLNRLQNRMLRRLVGAIDGEPIHDVACGVRALRPELLEALPLRAGLVRFLPALARRAGYSVVQVKTPVHARAMTARVHTPGLYARRLADVIGLLFLLRFADRPLRLFGPAGAALGVAGLASLGLAALLALVPGGFTGWMAFALGALCLLLSFQALGLGLLGELLAHDAAQRRVARREPPARGDS